jgi:pyruvate/2-oxoglutarate/acetoin dehydrogenase E1 component
VVREGSDLTILTYGTMVHVVASTLDELPDAPPPTSSTCAA